MMHIKPFQLPSNHRMYLFMAAWFFFGALFISYLPKSLGVWPFMVYFVTSVGLFLLFLSWDQGIYTKMRQQYEGYLSTLMPGDLVIALNDPECPKDTQAQLRKFMNSRHPGWHEKLTLQQG